MKESYTRANAGDFNQRYRHCFGFYCGEKENKLIYIDRCETDRVLFQTEDGSTWYANIDKGVMFDFEPLKTGFTISNKNTLLYVTRTPQRQWHRGISDSNHTVRYLASKNWMQAPLTWSIITQLFDKKDILSSIQDFIYSSGKIPAVLSPNFAMSNERVWFKMEEVGTVEKNVIGLNPVWGLVKQELSDALMRQNVNELFKIQIAEKNEAA